MLFFTVQSFVGVIIWGLFNPVAQVIPWGLSNQVVYPLPLANMSSCSGCWFWFLCRFWFFINFNGGYEATPLWVVRVPLHMGRRILHQGGRQALSLLLTWRGTYPFCSPSLFGHASCDPVWWVVRSILGLTICWHQWALTSLPLLHIHVPSEVHGYITLPKVFTHFQWMLQWTSMAEVMTSH